jgi:hypothetical protein
MPPPTPTHGTPETAGISQSLLQRVQGSGSSLAGLSRSESRGQLDAAGSSSEKPLKQNNKAASILEVSAADRKKPEVPPPAPANMASAPSAQPSTVASANAPEVLEATYTSMRDPTRGKSVKAQLQSFLNRAKTGSRLVISNATMGGDPAFGHSKVLTLKLLLKHNRRTALVVVPERSWLYVDDISTGCYSARVL